MDLLLFDIDGTLLRTRGAGREALDTAFREVLGWEQGTAGVSMAGATDGGIVRAVARRFGRDALLDRELAAVQRAYLDALATRLAEPGRAELCPGVRDLLDALAGRAHVALLTGNWRAGAAAKLRCVGLDGRFLDGAFGDDGVERDLLVPIARARAEEQGLRFRRVVVIGDTPADVSCARAGGAVAVAVETGFASREELHACGPDLLLPDLARGGAWLRAMVGLD